MARYGPSFRHLRLEPIDWAKFIGDKYKANDKDEEIIGIQNPYMIWQSLAGVDNSTDDAGNTGLSLSSFDTTSRADSAKIRLINSSGSTKTINGCVIRGKPVLRYSGDHGRVHDSLIDYGDIIKNGEKEFEFGNNYVCLRSQLDQLTDWYWKKLRKKSHVYGVEIPGRCYWYSPGEWYVLQITDVKGAEDINVTAECCHVQVEAQTNQLGRTVVVFREVYQSWVHDINAISYFLSGGDPVAAIHFDRIKIASSTYLNVADVYCDGVSDETEINAAIASFAGTGGGLVELVEGTFVTDGAIAPANNIGIVGHGRNTIIEKNGNYHGIELIGSSGSEYENILLQNFKITKNASDTNANKHLIYLVYCDNVIINNIYAYNSYSCGIVLQEGDNNKVVHSYAVDNAGSGIVLQGNINNSVSAHVVNNTALGNGQYGILIHMTTEGIVANNTCRDNDYDGIFYNLSTNGIISNNMCIDNAQAGAGTYAGISCSAGIGTGKNIIIEGNYCGGNDLGIELSNTMFDTQVHSNSCFNNGDDADIANTNNHNFADSGNDTYATGNSWQGPGA